MKIDEKILKFLKETVLLFFPNDSIKVYLFGSRATNKNHLKSDYDIAFDIPLSINDSEFLVTISEDAPTLCGIDAVNINRTTKSLKETIFKEGILIYESK